MSRRTRLTFESLDARQMLAVLGLDALMFSDDGGQPDQWIDTPATPLHAEDTFWLQVRAWDERTGTPPGDPTPGVIGLPLNLSWADAAADVIQYVGADVPEFPTNIPDDNPAVTPSFPLQRFVTTFAPGSIEGLRGGALPGADPPVGSAIGDAGEPLTPPPADYSEYAEFSLLQFQAVGAARAMRLDVALAGGMSFADAAALENEDASATATIRVQMEASGIKYRDVNGNGDYDPAVDTPLGGWEIRAYEDLDGDGILDQDEYDAGPVTSDVTGADGRYGLWLDTGDPTSDDPADPESMGSDIDYVIVEVLRPNWEQTSPADQPVLDPGLDTGAETLGANGWTLTVQVGSQSQDGLDFDNDPTGLASLSGFVYVDANGDGVRGTNDYGAPGELGLPNVTIGLYLGDADTPLEQVTTDPAGRYQFNDLEPGTYRVREESQPERFHDGQETLGVVLPGGDARGVAGEDEFSGIALAAGEDGVDYNFGELGLRAEFINKRMFLASTPSTKEIVAERQDVPTVTVKGTDGDDTIAIEADLAAAEPAVLVTVNGDEQSFPIAETRMLFVDAGGGNDQVTMTVTEPEETAYMLPGYASLEHEVLDGILRDWDYGVEVVNGEDIQETDASSGGNLTVIRDTPGDDDLTAAGNIATVTTLTSEDIALIARVVTSDALDRVRAISASGGDDTQDETLPLEFLLELIGAWGTP